MLTALLALCGLYLVIAYAILPAAWRHYEHQKGLDGAVMITRTAQGIPGDPLNVGLVGSQSDVVLAMQAVGWYPADPVTLRTSVRIVGSVLFDRPYRDAPVSALYYDGRREDMAFEQPDGNSADRRHHVRFWKVLERGGEGRPVWLGAATYDRGVGLSHYTGQVTHHIAPDIDTERDRLAAAFTGAGMVATLYDVTGIGPTLFGRNGGGDRYWTDGEIRVLVLVEGGRRSPAVARRLPSPLLVRLKNALWRPLADLASR